MPNIAIWTLRGAERPKCLLQPVLEINNAAPGFAEMVPADVVQMLTALRESIASLEVAILASADPPITNIEVR